MAGPSAWFLIWIPDTLALVHLCLWLCCQWSGAEPDVPQFLAFYSKIKVNTDFTVAGIFHSKQRGSTDQKEIHRQE